MPVQSTGGRGLGMLRTKYFDKILAAQEEGEKASQMPAFDPGRQRSTNRFLTWVKGLFLEDPRWWLGFLRRVRPTLRVGGLALVTRAQDVREVMERESEFTSPYGLEMSEMAGGSNFILGMQDGPDYRKLKSPILTAFPPDEVERRVRPIAARHAREIMDRASPASKANPFGFDAVGRLMKVVPVRICREYFGMLVDDEQEFANWSIALSSIFFADPFADRTTRELAVVASERMRMTVDRSIEAVRDGRGVPDTPLSRMVEMIDQGRLTRAEVHAVMLGMISGFAPTNLLAGGNCLDMVLSSRDAEAAIADAVASNETEALDLAILEAMRFKPIFIGPWRYASADLKIAAGTKHEKLIPKGCTVWPSTLSAMFDPEAVEEPNEFRPGRPKKVYMVYGHGIHACIGAEVARVQIGECMRAIFLKKNVRRVPGRKGRLTRLGAFPERLSITFDREPLESLVEPSLVTVVLPVRKGMKPEDVESRVAMLKNPPDEAARKALDESGIIHFTSLAIIRTGRTDEATRVEETVALVEISGDGDKRTVLPAYANHAGPFVRPVLEDICGLPPNEDLLEILDRASVEIGPGFNRTSGLGFAGTPGHTVARIKAEERLASLVQAVVERPRACNQSGAAEILREAREAVRAHGGFDWAFRSVDSNLEAREGSAMAAALAVLRKWFILAPLALLLGAGTLITMFYVFPPAEGVTRMAAAAIALALVAATALVVTAIGIRTRSRWLVVALVVVALALLLATFALGPVDGVLRVLATSIASVLIALAGLIVVLAIATAGVLAALQGKEKDERASENSIGLAKLAKIQEREDHYAQNNLTAVSTMKAGLLRRLTLRFTFSLILISAQKAFRPGFLSNINSIHFARWILVPGTDKLVFFSNYGGSWESYLEDFIAKSAKGLTGVWSNTVGYPRTNLLFFDGARDGDRFKRWARRQQVPTLFWYSAYPELTTQHIRANSRIRRGLCWSSDSEARDWVSLFGSRPRPRISQKRFQVALPQLPPPPEPLESGEIQAIFFNAFGKLMEGRLLAFSVPDGLPRAARREWLSFLAGRVSYGDMTPTVSAMTVGFGPTGLMRLGLDAKEEEETMRRFPNAFRQGMAHPERSRILDDTGDSKPDRWQWGGQERRGDVVVLCYAQDGALLDADIDEVKTRAQAAGLHRVAEVPLTVKRRKAPKGQDPEKQPAVEQFGFVDGISQPAVRGTARAISRVRPDNIVAAGEFLFGYRDEHGYYPVSPAVEASQDPTGILPRLRRRRGDDGVSERLHDFGRNGSFMVIRQFEQHVEKFNDYCSHAAQTLSRAYRDREITEEWVAGKMMGRWRDGSSLVRNPERRPSRFPDNDFSFGVEDPQGLRCPLGAHIRRSNPRDSLGDDHATQIQIGKRHRILRVGRTYEIDREDGRSQEMGLMFMCLNADIERQYEFMQQTWVASPGFHGLKEKDPAIGSSDEKGRFTIPRWEGNVVLEKLPNFVTTRGGGYFFMPSRSAMRYLVSRL